MSEEQYCSGLDHTGDGISDDDDDYYDDNDYYYGCGVSEDGDTGPSNNKHHEYFEYDCLTVQKVEELLAESVELISTTLQITPSMAKIILQSHDWDVTSIIFKHNADASRLFLDAKLKSHQPPQEMTIPTSIFDRTCSVCFIWKPIEKLRGLACGHLFCDDCWVMYFEEKISQGNCTKISCMEHECQILAPDDFVLSLLSKPTTRDKYQQFAFRDYVKSHPQLRVCPGPNCEVIVRAKVPSAKQVICNICKAKFCFGCGLDYHAPADCSTIKKWLAKCADNSETEHYITAYTKCCPKCQVNIEKYSGCEHMICYNCNYEFCWLCMRNWVTHANGHCYRAYYELNANSTKEHARIQARRAHQKYLYYYEWWKKHSVALQSEEQAAMQLNTLINETAMNVPGTWIDWQYLLNAATTLAKCRHTLQYTYPCAYYMESGPEKELFKCLQLQLETETENLSLKIEGLKIREIVELAQQEHAASNQMTIPGRADLENQMHVTEQCRKSLLTHFL